MTSGQYANLLLRKLQVYFSCSDTGLRAYLHNFFGSIFNDPSVELTKETTQNFIDQMEDEMNYAAINNYDSLSNMYNSDRFDASLSVLQSSFEAIGVTMTLTEDGDGPTHITFTLPSGEDKIWYCRKYNSYVRINSQLRVTEAYRNQMRTYYLLEDVDDDLSELGTNVAGYGTKWTLDSGELTISGDGSLASAYLWSELGILSDISTVIIGVGINHLTDGMIYSSNSAFSNGTTFVFLHSDVDSLRIDNIVNIASNSTTTLNYTIYTDNDYIRDYSFPSQVSITWHSLSEW